MGAFIKDGRTFVTKAYSSILDYAVKQSIYDVVSEVDITTPEILPETGDIIFIDDMDFFGIIKNVDVDNDKTSLKINQIVTLFDRNLVFTKSSYTYIEDCLESLINANYINCTDSAYAIPYLSAAALTHTETTINPDTEKSVYSIKSYLSKIRRLQNIFCVWDISRTELKLSLVKQLRTQKSVDFSNPSYKITEESYSQKTVGKITSICEENGETKDWYLLKNGNITNDSSVSLGIRVLGEWIVLNVPKAEDVENDVADEFRKNTYSHSIKFSAPIESGFELYDRVKVSINNELFESYVSTVIVEKNSDKMSVSLGELQTSYPYINLL